MTRRRSHSSGPRGGRPRPAVVLALLWATCWLATGAAAQERPVRSMYKSTHQRVLFDRDVQRVAVGDVEVLDFENISSRELLFLGKAVGRTSVIVWFADGSIEEFTMLVQRDLTVLERVLQDIHPGISLDVAPDRDAVVLRGVVPDVSYSIAAENAARSFLEAGTGRARGAGPPLVQAPRAEGAGESGAAPAGGGESPVRVEDVPERRSSSKAVINLLQLESLPETLEVKLRREIDEVGGGNVTIRRVSRGDVPDDAEDLIVLGGRVPDQVTLARVLTLAATIVAGETDTADNVEVIADESGALAGRGSSASTTVNTPTQSAVGGGTSALSGTSLENQVEANIARAKAIELAEGRVVSFIEVDDLPQVRVDISLYEVDRNKLFDFEPSSILVGSDFQQPSLNPATGTSLIQGEDLAARVGTFSEVDVQNVISGLGGALNNQLQIAGKNWAIDTAFNLLESRGIARTLQSPSLSVLSGEVAIFSVGGEIPISQNVFTDVTGDAGAAVLQETIFRSFGIELGIRPLVGDDGTVTVDLIPSISFPDPALTQSIRDTTGSSLDTTAFETRFLRTSARLRDGQSLIVGGLHTRSSSENTNLTPGLSRLPVLGWLFRDRATQDEELDLILVVHPVIVRDPLPQAALWAYPDVSELLDFAGGR